LESIGHDLSIIIIEGNIFYTGVCVDKERIALGHDVVVTEGLDGFSETYCSVLFQT
jgi:hypothetical protein